MHLHPRSHRHGGWAFASATGLALCAGALVAGVLPVEVAAPLAAACWVVVLPACARLRAREVLAVAALLHGLFLAVDFHGNDLHRYLWEGRVSLAGESPYAKAPSHPDLVGLRDARFAEISFPALPTVYPPLAQASFALAAALGARELHYRNAVLGLQLLLVALVCAWLARTGRPVGRAAWLAWSPVALASGASGHVDVLMALALVGFAWSWESGRVRAAALCLGLAILGKTVAVVLLPWALWRRPREVAAITLPVVALGFLPWALAGGVAGSLLHFAQVFRFNASLHELLDRIAGDAATPVAAALLVGWTAWVARRRDDVVGASVLALAGLLLVAPTVHYWYLTWLLVLLPAAPAAPWRPALLAWMATATLTAPLYASAARGGPPPADGLYALLVGLEYALPLGVGLLAAARSGRAAPAAAPRVASSGRGACGTALP